jgi:hypothetical protein
MELTELFDKIAELKSEYKKAKHEAIMQYVQEHAKFKVGDFIGNVTGCIKVEKISYEWNKRWTWLVITYSGKRYKKVRGEFLPCKEQRYNPPFRENDSYLK